MKKRKRLMRTRDVKRISEKRKHKLNLVFFKYIFFNMNDISPFVSIPFSLLLCNALQNEHLFSVPAIQFFFLCYDVVILLSI